MTAPASGNAFNGHSAAPATVVKDCHAKAAACVATMAEPASTANAIRVRDATKPADSEAAIATTVATCGPNSINALIVMTNEGATMARSAEAGAWMRNKEVRTAARTRLATSIKRSAGTQPAKCRASV